MDRFKPSVRTSMDDAEVSWDEDMRVFCIDIPFIFVSVHKEENWKNFQLFLRLSRVGSSPEKFLKREKRKEHTFFFCIDISLRHSRLYLSFAEREICENGGSFFFWEWRLDLPLQGRLRMARRAFAFLLLRLLLVPVKTERSPLFDSFRLLRSVPWSAREEALARRVER
jgi:hypothetical protein